MSHRPAPLVTTSLLLLVISVGVNAFQATRINALIAGESSVGRMAPVVKGVDPSGQAVSLTPVGSVPTVFYYFSAGCGWCEQNWPNIRVLSQRAGTSYRLVALSSGHIEAAYLIRRHLDLVAVGRVDEQTRSAFGFRGAPHTVVASSEGIITHDWPGAFVPRLQRRVEELFQLTLPGLSPDSDLRR
jgi:hypothetical protein